MTVSNGFLGTATAEETTPGAVVAGLLDGERFVGIIVELLYSTGVLVLDDQDEGTATPRMVPLDDVEGPLIIIDGDVRLEPLAGDAVGHLGPRDAKTNGMVRSMPDRSVRMWVQMGDGQGLWMDLETGDEAKGGDVRGAVLFQSWQLALYEPEGRDIRRLVLATHDYAP